MQGVGRGVKDRRDKITLRHVLLAGPVYFVSTTILMIHIVKR